MPQGERGVIELGRQQRLNLRSKKIERRRLDCFGDDRDARIVDFHAVWRLLDRGDPASHRNDGLKGQVGNLRDKTGIFDDDLRKAFGVTKNEKTDAAELAKPVNPTGEHDVFADVASDVDRPDTFHGSTPRTG